VKRSTSSRQERCGIITIALYPATKMSEQCTKILEIIKKSEKNPCPVEFEPF